MATPFVSGAIALMITRFPDESMAIILNRLYSSTDTLESLARRCRVGGRLNLSRALEVEMPRPLNDDFSNATSVLNSPLVVSGFNATATMEASEGTHDTEGTGQTVWWSWTADTDGFSELTSAGSDFNTMLAVYQGKNVDTLQLVAKYRDVSPTHSGASLGFNAEAGRVYRIAVDGLLGASGNISLSLGQTVVNDDFAKALEIEGINVIETGENIAATRESVEPDHVANTFGSKSVWWSWKAPLSGNVTISTSASNSFDTLSAVYTGSSLEALQLIGSNDDDGRTGVWTSALTLYAQEGETYKIAVDGWNDGFGEIGLTVAMAENDDFEDARSIVSDTFEDVSFTQQATKEKGEPDPDEAVILTTLEPGLYTVVLSGVDRGNGLGLIEGFDASSKSIETRLANISTRVRASTGQEVAISGFVITGQDPKRVLIRALGPELLKRNVSGVLSDPQMSLYRGQDRIAMNNDWEDENGFLITASSEEVNTSILDERSLDSAMVRELEPGLYTVIVSDVNSDTGIVLIEVHELP